MTINNKNFLPFFVYYPLPYWRFMAFPFLPILCSFLCSFALCHLISSPISSLAHFLTLVSSLLSCLWLTSPLCLLFCHSHIHFSFFVSPVPGSLLGSSPGLSLTIPWIPRLNPYLLTSPLLFVFLLLLVPFPPPKAPVFSLTDSQCILIEWAETMWALIKR